MSGYLAGVLARARNEGVLLRPLPRVHPPEPAAELDFASPAPPAGTPVAGSRRADLPAEAPRPSPGRGAPPPAGLAGPRAPQVDASDRGRPSPDLAEEPRQADRAAKSAAPVKPRRTSDDSAHQLPARARSEARPESPGHPDPVVVPARAGPRNGSPRDERARAAPPAARPRPVAAPLRDMRAPEAAPDPITVSIGRVEIRAAVPPPVVAPTMREPRQSLDEYLRARDTGRSG